MNQTEPMVSPPPIVAAAPTVGALRKKQLILAFVVAGASDAVSLWTEFIPPVEWALDVTTALLLFLVLGWRWLLLPALIDEAIPGLALFPSWILVVGSIAVLGGVRRPGGPRENTPMIPPL